MICYYGKDSQGIDFVAWKGGELKKRSTLNSTRTSKNLEIDLIKGGTK